MRVEFSGTDPSVIGRSSDPSTVVSLSPLDEERRRQQVGLQAGPDAGSITGSTRVTLSPQGRALLDASQGPDATDVRPRAASDDERSRRSEDVARTPRSDSAVTPASGSADQAERPSLRAAQQRLASAGIPSVTG